MYTNRIGWGLSFLYNVGALERPKRGDYVKIDAGRELILKFLHREKERETLVLGDDSKSLIRPVKSVSRR